MANRRINLGWLLQLTFVLLLLRSLDASAWGLKTHIWIGQQVLSDALPDGKVDLAGRAYPVPSHVLAALREHPSKYLTGHLGPDIFPDPIVGQTTIHPGVKSGWQTDDWLRTVLSRAANSEEIAFAYGFVGHAAGDVFAHTYVNLFAGHVFELTHEASRREVERRHFVLEKYIEARTPSVDLNNLSTPTKFVRDRLILDPEASRQYGRVSSASHLVAMNEVRHTVANFQRETQKIIEQLTAWAAKYLKAHARLTIDLATAKHAVQAAGERLKVEEELLKLRIQAYDAAKRILEEARDIVNRNPELINANQRLLIEQTRLAAEALADATRIGSDVAREIGRLEDRIRALRKDVSKFACRLILWPPAVKRCEEEVGRIIDQISDLERAISGQRERQRIADDAARRAAELRDQTRELLGRLRAELDKATKGLADKSYEVAVAAADVDVRAQKGVLKLKQRALAEAKRIQESLEKELGKLVPVIDEIKEVVDRYNPVTALLQNWLSDIDIAADEYVKAGHRAGEKILRGNGNPAAAYKEWFDCYGQVFTAQPKEIGQAGCFTKQFLRELQTGLDNAVNRLPEILRWLISPTREATRRGMKELKPHLERAGLQLLTFATGRTTAEFLWLLANPENATKDRLVAVFREDNSKLNLIRFDDVSQYVDKDLAVQNNVLNPVNFVPLLHSVILAKLSLLSPAELNQLVQDLVGEYTSPLYGSPLYRSEERNFSVLLDVVRSIDGNHQWQAYGLPWPRRVGVKHDSPTILPFGHDHFHDRSKGLRIWVDPYLREKVFLKLFPGTVAGAISDRQELKWPAYRFPSCSANPFPATQDARGQILIDDRRCIDAKDPNRPIADRPFEDSQQYRSRYFSCANQGPRERRFTLVVASPNGLGAAERKKRDLAARYPDMHFELLLPAKDSPYFAVVAARCSSRQLADEAREVALGRLVAPDAFLVTPIAP